MRLADTKPDHGPLDPFKTQYNQKQVKNEVAPKIHTLNHWQPSGN
jgi:hypothetical protein